MRLIEKFTSRVFLAAFLVAIPAMATHIAVLETGIDSSVKDRVTLSDRQYLTNVLREQAVKELPATQDYTIMTRENINAMLPPGKAIEDCEGSCLAETGRNIAADYICQARVGSFGSKLTLSAELYETAGNKLVASFNGYGMDVEELLNVIKTNSQDFFRSVKDGFAGVAEVGSASVSDSIVEENGQNEMTGEKDIKESVVEDGAENTNPSDELAIKTNSVEEETRVKANVAYDELDGKNSMKVSENVLPNVENKEGKTAKWIVFGISSALAVTGAVLAVVGNNQAKEAYDKKADSENGFQKRIDDAKSGQNLRGVGIGLAIAGTVGIGISFAF